MNRSLENREADRILERSPSFRDHRRPFRTIRAGLLVAAAVAGLGAGAAPDETRFNVVLLMSDDQGWGELRHAGHSRLHTPELDKMAAGGMRFERFYAAAPLCSPTRASVMTGRHPVRSGVLSHNYALRPEEIALPALLQRAGYRTGHFGKWHLGPVKADSPVNPRAFGFDTYLSADRAFNTDDVLSRNGAEPIQFKGEGSEIVAHEAIGFMRRATEEGKPFFAVIWFGSPHRPYAGTAENLARYDSVPVDLAGRYAEITAMDLAIGRIRQALRKMKAGRRTLVWFCSDNGPPKDVVENGGLRGHKGSLDEGGIRVPGIVEWPGVIAKGRVAPDIAGTSDILPTILDLAGIEAPDRPLDGVSLRPLIEGKKFAHPPIGFWSYPTANEQKNPPWLSAKDLRGVAHPQSPRPPAVFYNFRHPVPKTSGFTGEAAWIDGRWKLITRDDVSNASAANARRKHTQKLVLFDLSQDPGEQRDVAPQNPAVVARMRDELILWQRSVESSASGADYPVSPGE